METSKYQYIVALPGQFLLKDLMLLGAAIWTAGEALRAANWGTNRMNADAV